MIASLEDRLGVRRAPAAVLGSFEYREPDSQAMSSAGAKPVKIDEGPDLRRDLELYFIQ